MFPVHLLLGLLPVLAFLAVLIVLDSFKLVRLGGVLQLLAVGAALAGAALVVHRALARGLGLEPRALALVAPFTEELLKGSVVVALLLRRRVGFLVDAAICGFAVGAGFAAAENLYFLLALDRQGVATWLVRGFGTAILHGGVTASFAVWSRSLADRRGSLGFATFAPGLLLAMLVHALFNRILLAPDLATLLLLAALAGGFVAVFRLSERRTRGWLGTGFDTDAELLAVIQQGRVSTSRVGEYLRALQRHFRPETLADLLCLLRLRLELSLRAKGILLMRQAGVQPQPDPEVAAKFEELAYLERSIGRTGLRALAPILNFSDQDLWQYHMLRRER